MKGFITLFVVTFLFMASGYAQKIKFKNNAISLDGETCFTYKRENAATITKVLNLDGNLVLSMSHDNEEFMGTTTSYVSVYFAESKRKFRSDKLSGYYFKALFKLLIENAVVNKVGEVDMEKLDEFVAIYA